MESDRNFKIIVIDDNPPIHQDFKKILTPKERERDELDILRDKLFDNEQVESHNTLPGFYIETATQGQEGVEKIKVARKEGNPFALAFVDVRMPPGWDGIETIKHIWGIDPDIQVVICTAYSDYTWEETLDQLGITDNLLILKKPFDSTAVRQLASALTKKWELMAKVKERTELLEKNVEERTASLRSTLSRARSILESSMDGIVVTDNQGKIIDYNQQFIKLWQVPESIITSKNYPLFIEYILQNLNSGEEFALKVKELMDNLEGIHLGMVNLADGQTFELYSQPQKLEGRIIGRVWSFRDMTKRILLEKKLEIQATHDALTGLPNRVLLLDRLQQAILEARRNKEIVAVLFLDLDRFKLINDSLTHHAGDQLLKELATRLKECLRNVDTIARHGGDEFVIIVQELKTEKSIVKIVQKILGALNKPFHIANRQLTVSVSIGIAFYSRDGITPDELLSSADLAMYRAKALGGNQFQIYSADLNKQASKRLEIENGIREALKNGEFYLYYQPQYNIMTKEIIAMEALVRWKHPVYGEMLPIDFIPIAEETGLIIPLGEWVLREACKQNKLWQEAEVGHFQIAINVSSQQLKCAKFLQSIKKILKETKLDPQYLEVEITENVIVSNPEVTRMINQISKLGVHIALDDFGTGNSTLSGLLKIHIDRIKIDRSFIQDITVKTGTEVIIKAIIDMSRSLNYDIVAEGVETQKQIDFLKDRNCEVIQGYYFGRPMSSKDTTTFLTSQPPSQNKSKGRPQTSRGCRTSTDSGQRPTG